MILVLNGIRLTISGLEDEASPLVRFEQACVRCGKSLGVRTFDARTARAALSQSVDAASVLDGLRALAHRCAEDN
jgi:hypothetical protein